MRELARRRGILPGIKKRLKLGLLLFALAAIDVFPSRHIN